MCLWGVTDVTGWRARVLGWFQKSRKIAEKIRIEPHQRLFLSPAMHDRSQGCSARFDHHRGNKMTPTARKVLAHIPHRPEFRLSPSDIGRRINTRHANVRRALRQLVDAACCTSFQSHSARTMRRAAIGELRDETSQIQPTA